MTGNTPHNLHAKLDQMASAKKSEIAMDVQKVNNLDDAHSRILVHVPNVFHSRLNEENMTKEVASKFENVRYLPNSLHKASDSDPSLVGFFAARNRETISMEQASASGFVSVSDTVFQDENDNIWTVFKNGDVAYLVKQAEEDINSLISAVKTRAIATASLDVDMSEDYNSGLPFLYYDFDKEEVAFAIGVNGATAYVPSLETVKSIEAAQVLITADSARLNIVESEIASRAGKEDILEFMKILYSHNKDFLAEINDIIRNQITI